MRSARPCRLCKVRNPPSVSLRGEKCYPEGIEGGERVVVVFLLLSHNVLYIQNRKVRKGRREDEQGSRKREGEEQKRKENVRAERRRAKGRVRH